MDNQLQDLIDKCSKGDRQAQYLLYQKYSPLLYGLALRYSYSQMSAEDILQEAFVKIFASLKDFKFEGSFEGWLKRVVINTAITSYHKDLKHRHHADLTDYQEILASDEPNFDSQEFTLEELLSVVNSLPDGYKMVFNLYAVEGFKHREIADMLGIDINTSKSQFMRARMVIIKKLKDLKKIKTAAL
ncbi:MAG: RNA polymerase sigma factor [Bacteroidales bacterium]|jgi:RNA polymerase sigma-70 factor (ECF subfamily)|nr:RNA polymerase sigma factor [Bacteroidales bacterium]MBR6277969.1 RNA polymerase sigma factor [Bacteroidales bacterium]MCR4560805.1 RNA polymerase sigma factor [Bacteroidales bacterium]